MKKRIFQSQYPILEACMNKGSTLELALAVHSAGAYPSLCSWTYNRRPQTMQNDLDLFVSKTGSNCIHLSFELYEWPDVNDVISIIKSHSIPTIEIIYGKSDSFIHESYNDDFERDLLSLLEPIKSMGTKIFRRIYDPVDSATAKKHLLDGFCIKGQEAAGLTSLTPLKDIFLQQKKLTPELALIPYGGIGIPDQVKEYIDLGAEMIGVGTLLAMSMESPIKLSTKQKAVSSNKNDITPFQHALPSEYGIIERKQNVIEFDVYQEPDDTNRTKALVRGLYRRNADDGLMYIGHSVDHINEILPCREIVQNLVSKL